MRFYILSFCLWLRNTSALNNLYDRNLVSDIVIVRGSRTVKRYNLLTGEYVIV